MLTILPQLYENRGQDLVVRFRMCMLVSFSISYLFETVLDTAQKDAAIDNLLRCLIEDIKEEKKSQRILNLVALDTLKQVTGEDNLGLRI